MGRAPLLADTDKSMLSQMVKDPLALEHEAIFASDPATVALEVERESKRLMGVAINPNLGWNTIRRLCESLKERQAQIPIVLMVDSAAVKIPPEQELRYLGIQRVITKPLQYCQLVDALILAGFAAGPQAPSRSLVDHHYTALHSANFGSEIPAAFDVFYRLASGEYLKILAVGSSFAASRVRDYRDAGLDKFYVTNQAQRVAAESTFSAGDQTIAFLRDAGVSDSSVTEAKRYVKQVSELVQQLQGPEVDQLRSLLATLAKHEHAISNTVIASLLLQPLGVNSQQGLEIIGLASLAHDIGMNSHLQELVYKKDAELSESETKTLHQHPITGAELLAFIPKVSPLTVKAIEQHHERYNGTGYPKGLKGNQIGPFAEIVGIADEFSSAIERVASGASTENPLVVMQKLIDGRFSAATVHAFRKIFLAKAA